MGGEFCSRLVATPALGESTPLVQLQDGLAPYKGVWCFEQTEQGRVNACHCTNSREQGPNCVIENKQFESRKAARRFIGHLVIHGWGVVELQPAGETLLFSSSHDER